MRNPLSALQHQLGNIAKAHKITSVFYKIRQLLSFMCIAATCGTPTAVRLPHANAVLVRMEGARGRTHTQRQQKTDPAVVV